MKKIFFFVFSIILVFIPLQAFAAPLEIHGDITKVFSSDDFNENTDILETILAGKYSLELSLTGNNDNIFKAGIKNIGNDPNLNYTRNESYYIDYSSPVFSLWFAKGINVNYPVVTLGDPMGVGNLPVAFRTGHLGFSLFPAWSSSYVYEDLYDYKYYKTEGIIPNFQVGANLNLGKFNFVGSYGQYYIVSHHGPIFSQSDPLSDGLYSSIGGCEGLLNILMLRGTFNFNDNLNLGLSFINYNKNNDFMGGPNEGYSNLILDVTGENPYIGGNYTLALLGTINNPDSCNTCNTGFFAEDGFGVYAALKDIPIGKLHQFKLGIDFAGAQEYCGFCSLNVMAKYNYLMNIYPETNFSYNSLRLGASLATTVDLEEFGYIDFTLRNYLTSTMPNLYYPTLKENLAYNILSLESDLNTPSGSNANLLAAFTYDIKEPEYSNIFVGLKADVVVNRNFTINGKIWFSKGSDDLKYVAQIGAIGKWDLPTNDSVAAADYTIGAMAGINDGFTWDFPWDWGYNALAYMELNSRFTNNLGLSMATYMDNNYYVYYLGMPSTPPSLNSGLFNFIATVTGEYWFTDKLVLSLTGTYRNWEPREVYYSEKSSGLFGNKDLEEHSFVIEDNFFAMLALTYNIDNNSSVQLSWGRSGLADKEVTDPAKYPDAKVYPWMKLSIAPRYGEMSWKTVKLSFNVKF